MDDNSIATIDRINKMQLNDKVLVEINFKTYPYSESNTTGNIVHLFIADSPDAPPSIILKLLGVKTFYFFCDLDQYYIVDYKLRYNATEQLFYLSLDPDMTVDEITENDFGLVAFEQLG